MSPEQSPEQYAERLNLFGSRTDNDDVRVAVAALIREAVGSERRACVKVVREAEVVYPGPMMDTRLIEEWSLEAAARAIEARPAP